MRPVPEGRTPFLRLGLLTLAALGIQGYHLGVEDGEIYIPAAKKLLRPELYPYATEFFTSHGRMSLFSPILAWTARLTHLSADWTVFLWYLVSLFAVIYACWLLAEACFESSRARWCALLVITAVLSMPATNTSLLLVDPYLTARSFSTPLTIYALARFLKRRYWSFGIAAVFTATIHPLMVVYLVFLAGVIWFVEIAKPKVRTPAPVLAAAMLFLQPLGFHFAPATGPYREALYSRDYLFLWNWEWYHWIGLLAPLAILAWFWKGRLRGTRPGFARLSFAMIPFGVLSILGAMVIASSHSFDMFARLQPLRSFHLITIIFMLLLGGVIGEYFAKDRPWVLAALFVPVAAGMFLVARMTYPGSPQVEVPGATTSSNAWVNALLWVRANTPVDAVFAVDSRYFKDDATDVHGFRSVSERTCLADYFKDGGVAEMFPLLAPEWKQQSDATYGLNHFQKADFDRLAQRYPVSWTVIHGAAPKGMDCPYDERGFAVCRIR